jgi:hypothetical protein
VSCKIVDSPDGDGSCDLSCSMKAPKRVVTWDSLLGDDEGWWLGYDWVPATIKVVFPAT